MPAEGAPRGDLAENIDQAEADAQAAEKAELYPLRNDTSKPEHVESSKKKPTSLGRGFLSDRTSAATTCLHPRS
jgi:hypothetical protein